MKRLTLLLLLVVSCWQLAIADTTKPWTFWYWMYGAVSEQGIKADLQAMKDVGLGGCYLMPIRGAEERPEYQGQANAMSNEFWKMVDVALEEADKLDLEMGIHVCDGFALAGGPWIKPEESMQKVVFCDTIVRGGHHHFKMPTSSRSILLKADQRLPIRARSPSTTKACFVLTIPAGFNTNCRSQR